MDWITPGRQRAGKAFETARRGELVPGLHGYCLGPYPGTLTLAGGICVVVEDW